MGWIKTNNLYGKVIQTYIAVMKQGCFADRESMWHSSTISCSDLQIQGTVSIDIYADKLISDDLLGIAHSIRLSNAYYGGWIVYIIYFKNTFVVAFVFAGNSVVNEVFIINAYWRTPHIIIR